VNELAVEIEAAIREVISTFGLTSADLSARLEALLPGLNVWSAVFTAAAEWGTSARSAGPAWA
jgi:hypothetical protein